MKSFSFSPPTPLVPSPPPHPFHVTVTTTSSFLLIVPATKANYSTRSLLDISINDISINFLANTDEIRLLRTIESRTFDAFMAASAAVVKSNYSRILADVRPRIAYEPVESSRNWKLTEATKGVTVEAR
ncbi:conserved hypothetical protein [Ricinus communis]|uniref:Uncharacterized protein n=1 Tax=Ricinus communis TaxID=3988 RepID=B9RDS6_RICCO|nr:conserved hypothetical protein [Ricinus communis]